MTALHLLRHARVDSHAGDIPLAGDAGPAIDAAAARILAVMSAGEDVVFLSAGTHRTRETARALAERIGPHAARASDWGDHPALRNPDLWLGGWRVEMVSTLGAYAAQLPPGAADERDVATHPFFAGFVNAPDRIGFWLAQPSPPGDRAVEVARRVLAFARSVRMLPGGPARLVCVTHSPVLRALITAGLGQPDPGEPGWVEGVEIELGQPSSWRFRGASGSIPAP